MSDECIMAQCWSRTESNDDQSPRTDRTYGSKDSDKSIEVELERHSLYLHDESQTYVHACSRSAGEGLAWARWRRNTSMDNLKSTSNEKMDFAFYCYLDTWVHLKLCNARFLANSHERRRKKQFFLCPPRCDFWKIHVLFTSYVIEEKAETRMRSAPSTHGMHCKLPSKQYTLAALCMYWGYYARVSPLSPQWRMM